MSEKNWKSAKLDSKLRKKLSPGHERGGLILSDGAIVELDNHSEDPSSGFRPTAEALLPHADDFVATWHTHPGATANLSVEDWETFIQWPDQLHAIVGSDGVRWYGVKNGAVINA